VKEWSRPTWLRSCEELRDVIGLGFQGCMPIPAGLVGGDEERSEGGAAELAVAGLCWLIATAEPGHGCPE
jgi:hypothetical protein